MPEKSLGRGLDALIPKTESEHRVTVEEVKKVLKVMDDLLEKLPDDVVHDFALSDDFVLYARVLEEYGI